MDRKYGSPTSRVLAAPEMKNGQELLAPNYIYQKTMAVNDCNTQEIIILYEVRRDMKHKLELLFVPKNMLLFLIKARNSGMPWEIIVQVTLQFLRKYKSTYCFLDIYVNLTSAAVLYAIILSGGGGGGKGRVAVAVAIHFSFTAVEVFGICPPYQARTQGGGRCTGCTCIFPPPPPPPGKKVPFRNVQKRRESSVRLCRQKRMCTFRSDTTKLQRKR